MATGTDQSKPAYCPACKYFGYDCNPDEEDYHEPCDAFEAREERSEIWL